MFQVVSIAQSRGHSKPMKCVTAGVVFSAGRGYHVSLSEGKVVSERNLLRVLGIGALIQGQTTNFYSLPQSVSVCVRASGVSGAARGAAPNAG